MREGDRVRIEVADNGDGIPEEFRGRIFEKFSQADASHSRQKGGTGLGLHISKTLVERMDGTIGFVTEAGYGATFRVELSTIELDTAIVAVPHAASSDVLAPQF